MSMRSLSAMALAPHRVAAMVLRYLYLLRSSWSRVLDLIYWPAVQLLVWGFLQLYITQNSGFFARAGGVFIGAVMMWDILFRGQLGFSISTNSSTAPTANSPPARRRGWRWQRR